MALKGLCSARASAYSSGVETLGFSHLTARLLQVCFRGAAPATSTSHVRFPVLTTAPRLWPRRYRAKPGVPSSPPVLTMYSLGQSSLSYSCFSVSS